jgi:hypothetical protein
MPTPEQLAAESMALYQRLSRRSLTYPADHPQFIRVCRVMQKLARRCYRRNVIVERTKEQHPCSSISS